MRFQRYGRIIRLIGAGELLWRVPQTVAAILYPPCAARLAVRGWELCQKILAAHKTRAHNARANIGGKDEL